MSKGSVGARKPGAARKALAGCIECIAGLRCWPEAGAALQRALVQRLPPIERGRWIWRRGDAADALYVVAQGCVRLSACAEDGSERVFDFAWSGELIGLDAIAATQRVYDARALERTALCRLYWDPAGESEQHAAIDKALLRRLARERDPGGRAATGCAAPQDVDQALRRFIESAHARAGTREPGGLHRLRLPMSRADLASYLGYAEETISRAFARLRLEDPTLEVRGRELRWQTQPQ